MFNLFKKLKNLPFLFILIPCFILSSLILETNVQAATLLGATDFFSDDTLSEPNVTHNVSFVIPLSGHTIIPTDYIRIIFTNYAAVTAPTSGSGWTGVPAFGITGGNIAYVTNVSASPGDAIGISGMTATNPAGPALFDITIEIANDVVGSIIYDNATVSPQVIRESISTSVTVGGYTSSLEFFGFTSPQAFVTIMLNGSVAGTTTADINGNFHKQITGLLGDVNYSVSIFAQDTFLRQTQTVSFIVHTIPFMNLIISNIVIPTTLDINKLLISQGDTLSIYGYSHPFSQITIWVETYTDVVAANASGSWTYTFNSNINPLGVGAHLTYAKEVVFGGFESIFSLPKTFMVSYCGKADINCDGFVNLTDFSIMLFYWHQYSPANPRADISGDNYVDLIDFSIMMFYWTG